MIYLCEYLFVMNYQPRTFWDKLTGYVYKSRGMILIKADSEDLAEKKFKAWYESKHPGRVLKAYDIKETIE